MNKNIYINFILTILTISVTFFGFMFITSTDALRKEAEDIKIKISKFNDKMDSLKKELQNAPLTYRPEKRNSPGISADTSGKMANAEFFSPEAVPGGRIIRAAASDTKNMNNIINNDSFVSNVWSYCYDSLAVRNYRDIDSFEPQLAMSWQLSSDKKTYTVKLKKGILWHDFKDPVTGKTWQNKKVTAEDFKFYVDVIKNKNVECPFIKVYYQFLDRIEVVNPHEFKVRWKKKYIKSEEITMGLMPLPRHLYHTYEGPFDGIKFNEDHRRNKIIVGCGPYKFSRWQKGSGIILEKWDKYYGAEFGTAPSLEYIKIDIIKHQNTRFQGLLSGKIDEISFSPEQWKFKTSTEKFDPEKGSIKKLKYPRRAYYYIGYNLKKPMFKDKRVRQALTHCINRKKILKNVYYGLGRIVTGPFFIDSIYYDQKITPYPYSIKKALELLGKAGWKDSDNDGILDKNGKDFEFTILQVANSEIQKKMLPLIKEDLAKAGIVMKIQTIEWSVLTQRLEKKNFEACTLGWTSALLPDPYQLWHSSQANKKSSSNHIGFSNEKADRLIEQIRVTFDMKKRVRLCHEFHKLLHDLQPYTFLFSPYNLMGINARYKNIRVFPLGIPDNIMWVPKERQMPLPGML